MEKSYLADLLGTRASTQKEETGLTVDAVAEHINEHGITSLLEIAAAIGKSPNRKGKIVVVGRVVPSGKVCGLRVVSEDEAESLSSSSFFHLFFEFAADSQRLVSAYGQGSLALAAKLVSGQIKRELDVVETAYLAGLLGTQVQSQSDETSLTVDAVAKHIKENGIVRLLEIAAAVGKFQDWKGKMVVAGMVVSGGKIRGLRVVSEKEAESLSEGFFRLGFEPVADKHRLVSASRKGSSDLAAALVSGQIGRELDVAEKSYLAGLLGTHAKSKSEETDLTIDTVAKHIRENGIARFLEIAAVVGKSPNWKGKMVVAGNIDQNRKISGLRVVSEEEAESLSASYFCLGFEFAADKQRLVSASGSGWSDLAAAWVSGQLGGELDVVEKSYLASLLGTRICSQNEETDLTVDAVAKHIRENGIARLLDIAAVVGKSPKWKGKIVVAGISVAKGKIHSLRVVNEEEAEKLSKVFFHVTFERLDGIWQLVSASHSGSNMLMKKIQCSDERASRSESGSASVDAMTFGAVFLADMLAKSARHAAGRIGRIMKFGRPFGNIASAASGISAQFVGNPSFACAADVYIPFGMQGGMAPPPVPMMPMFVHGMI